MFPLLLPTSTFVTNSFWSDSIPQVSFVLFDNAKNQLTDKIVLDPASNKWSLSHPETDKTSALVSRQYWLLAHLRTCSFRMSSQTDFTSEVLLPQNMLRATWIPISITATACLKEMTSPVRSLFEFKVQRNKSAEAQFQTLLAFVGEMFSVHSDPVCKLVDYEIVTQEGSTVSSGDSLFARLLQSQKVQGSVQLKMDTKSSSLTEEVFKFKIRAIQKDFQGFNRVKNPKLADAIVRLGCFEEAYLRVRSLATSKNNFFKSFNGAVLNLELPIPVSGAQSKNSLDLATMIEFYSDIEGCGAYKLSAFKD